MLFEVRNLTMRLVCLSTHGPLESLVQNFAQRWVRVHLSREDTQRGSREGDRDRQTREVGKRQVLEKVRKAAEGMRHM